MSELTEERRAQIAQKIKALLAKTTEAGCTENEAFSAAMAAARLQAEYNISLTEAELFAEGFEEVFVPWTSARAQFVEDRIATSVAAFTNTRVWVVRPKITGRALSKRAAFKTVFCGFKGNAVFAAWLLESLRDYIIRSANFYAGTEDARPGSRKSFTLGACERIATRLFASRLEATVQKSASRADASRALVVLDTQALITEHLSTRGLQFESVGAPDDVIDNGAAFREGRAAGEHAGLNRPINNNGKTHYIK